MGPSAELACKSPVGWRCPARSSKWRLELLLGLAGRVVEDLRRDDHIVQRQVLQTAAHSREQHELRKRLDRALSLDSRRVRSRVFNTLSWPLQLSGSGGKRCLTLT